MERDPDRKTDIKDKKTDKLIKKSTKINTMHAAVKAWHLGSIKMPAPEEWERRVERGDGESRLLGSLLHYSSF